jgi:hypothetical protein
MDVMFGFNLDYCGNRDQIVAEALLSGSPLASLVNDPNVRAVESEPSLVVALDEQCHLQARLSLETRSSSYQVRTGQYEEEPISIYFTIRRYPSPSEIINLPESFARQCRACEEMATRIIVPNVIQPILAAIASGH